MSTVTIKSNSSTVPWRHVAPLVETKKLWADADWKPRPELQFVRANWSASGDDLGGCELKRRYGTDKRPYETALAAVKQIDLLGHWVRISYVSEDSDAPSVAWIGQISSEPRDVHGDSSSPSGAQTFVAYSPLQVLRKIAVSTSYWEAIPADPETGADPAGTTPVEPAIDWVPPMNFRSADQSLVGNRTDIEQVESLTYVYGGQDLWTHRQYIEYLLNHFVGDDWRLSGQADALDQLVTFQEWDATQTVAEMIRKLIPLSVGLDYIVRAYSETIPPEEEGDEPTTDEGFEIYVYSLSSEAQSSGGVTIPANRNKVRIEASNALDLLRVNIVTTNDHNYDRIRVIGERVVVCCTVDKNRGLVPGWSEALETEYNAASAQQRKADRYRDVYQHYQVQTDWDFLGGSAAPQLGPRGTIVEGASSPSQGLIRSTLRTIPLFEGYDYSTDPATDDNADGIVPDLRPPLVTVFAEQSGDGEVLDRHVPVDKLDIDVSVCSSGLGVYLRPEANHVLGRDHFTGDVDYDEPDALYDYDSLSVTLAFESDERLMLTYTRGGATQDASKLLTKDIYVKGAELWYLAPAAITDIAADGTSVGPVDGVVLRNDFDKLDAAMAGALNRYRQPRARAEIVLSGLLPWHDFVGKILTVLEEGDSDAHQIGAPITAIAWSAVGSPTTTLYAGFAS